MPKLEIRLPNIKTVATVLGIYGAGVVTAGFFLSGPGEYAGRLQAPAAYEQQHQQPAVQQPAAQQQGPHAGGMSAQSAPYSAPPRSTEPPSERIGQVRVIPIERPSATTTGFGGERRAATREVASDADADPDAAPAGCNVSACRAQYRSFDARTCTYRSYEGTTKRCTR